MVEKKCQRQRLRQQWRFDGCWHWVLAELQLKGEGLTRSSLGGPPWWMSRGAYSSGKRDVILLRSNE